MIICKRDVIDEIQKRDYLYIEYDCDGGDDCFDIDVKIHSITFNIEGLDDRVCIHYERFTKIFISVYADELFNMLEEYIEILFMFNQCFEGCETNVDVINKEEGMQKNDAENKYCWSHKHDYPIEEIWNTYYVLSQLILPRLKAFKALDKHGHPADFKDITQWNTTIQKMIDAFELMARPSVFSNAEENEKITEGLELFCKYFCNLWD